MGLLAGAVPNLRVAMDTSWHALIATDSLGISFPSSSIGDEFNGSCSKNAIKGAIIIFFFNSYLSKTVFMVNCCFIVSYQGLVV